MERVGGTVSTGSWCSASCTPAASTGEDGDNYEYSLGLNGLGSCATQYASEYFDATIYRDGQKYTLHFEKGENIGGLHKEPAETSQDWLQIPLEAGLGGVYRH